MKYKYELPMSGTLITLLKNYIIEEKKEEKGECVLQSYAGLSAQRFQSMLHSRVLSGHTHFSYLTKRLLNS